MNYVIFDLEWNNAYNYKAKTGMNEIIEIGAVMLNEQLDIVDSFKQLIVPRVSKKLSSHCKQLTHITIDEIKRDGMDFDVAFKEFARWSDYKNSIFMSWSNSDLYVLVSNFKKFQHISTVPFITKYADVQKYCMSYLPQCNPSNQISLSNCAEIMNITIEEENLHRALEDCWVTASCFRKVFNKDDFEKYIDNCTGDYFQRLVYKPYFISTPKSELFNIENEKFYCPKCREELKISNSVFDYYNNTFKNYGICPKCANKYWLYIRAKKLFDSVNVTKKVLPMNKRRSKRLDENKNI